MSLTSDWYLWFKNEQIVHFWQTWIWEFLRSSNAVRQRLLPWQQCRVARQLLKRKKVVRCQQTDSHDRLARVSCAVLVVDGNGSVFSEWGRLFAGNSLCNLGSALQRPKTSAAVASHYFQRSLLVLSLTLQRPLHQPLTYTTSISHRKNETRICQKCTICSFLNHTNQPISVRC